MQKKFHLFYRAIVCLSFLQAILGCTASKSKYEKEYGLLWKELIQSEAWRNSLLTRKNLLDEKQTDLYTSTAEIAMVDGTMLASANPMALFLEKYDDLVARAYFKIISEAERADADLKKEHAYWNDTELAKSKKNDKAFRQQLALINKKYRAHQAMLQGLKSWNIFSENRSGDLDFFKAENELESLELYRKGGSEDQIVNLLIYKLADLYHFEEQ